MTIPLVPTATSWLPVQATLRNEFGAPVFRAIQFESSGEVNTVPESPTATHCVPAQVTAFIDLEVWYGFVCVQIACPSATANQPASITAVIMDRVFRIPILP